MWATISTNPAHLSTRVCGVIAEGARGRQARFISTLRSALPSVSWQARETRGKLLYGTYI